MALRGLGGNAPIAESMSSARARERGRVREREWTMLADGDRWSAVNSQPLHPFIDSVIVVYF